MSASDNLQIPNCLPSLLFLHSSFQIDSENTEFVWINCWYWHLHFVSKHREAIRTLSSMGIPAAEVNEQRCRYVKTLNCISDFWHCIGCRHLECSHRGLKGRPLLQETRMTPWWTQLVPATSMDPPQGSAELLSQDGSSSGKVCLRKTKMLCRSCQEKFLTKKKVK